MSEQQHFVLGPILLKGKTMFTPMVMSANLFSRKDVYLCKISNL